MLHRVSVLTSRDVKRRGDNLRCFSVAGEIILGKAKHILHDTERAAKQRYVSLSIP